jgi:hypothetical protein
MHAQNQPFLFETSRRGLRRLLGAGTLCLTLAAAASAQTPLCSGGFDVGLEPRTFDGESFDVVRLASPIVTLSAYSFGAWAPIVSGVGESGLVLRHRGIGGITLVVSPVDEARNPVATAQWEEYVAAVRQSFGEAATLGPVADSSADPKVVQVLDWTTREVSFIVPQPEGREPYVEQHLVVSGEHAGVAFVLSGPQSRVDAAGRDFRFFLARLDHGAAVEKISPPSRLISATTGR